MSSFKLFLLPLQSDVKCICLFFLQEFIFFKCDITLSRSSQVHLLRVNLSRLSPFLSICLQALTGAA